MKKKFLLAGLAVALFTNTYANYQIIIGTPKNLIVFKEQVWKTIEPKILSWVNAPSDDPYYRYECTNWSPATSTVNKGETFTQTATDCKGKQYASLINQEQNQTTHEVRTVGEEYTDKSQEQVVTNLTNTQSAVGIKAGYLQVMNPVTGKNGIYQISDGKGGTSSSYVNMTDDGGNWILIGRWTQMPSSAPVRYFKDVAMVDGAILSYTNDATNYPVLPSGSINKSSRILFKSANATWISMFGTWQSFNTFASTANMTNGFTATTSIGTKTLYPEASGWPTRVKTMYESFGLWTTSGNGGPCGGANIAGSNRICPSFTYATAPHFDVTSVKEVYIKASN